MSATSSASQATQATTAERIAALTRRSEALRERRTRVMTLVEAEERRAQEASTLAEQQFGTSDLEKLRAMYAEQMALFDQAWFDFEVEMDQVEEVLLRAEAQLKAV